MEFAFDLKDIFGTFAVGFFVSITFMYVLFSAASCIRILRGNQIKYITFLAATRAYLKKRTDFLKMISLILLVLVYAIGDIAEMLTEHYSDSRTAYEQNFFAKNWATLFSLDEENLRAKTLFKTETERLGSFVISKTHLGNEIFSNDSIISKVILEHPKESGYNIYLKNIFAHLDAKESKTINKNYYNLLTDDCSAIYYMSKNWAYSHVNYFQELQTIQLRIDFCRSVSLLGFIFLVFFLLLFFIAVLLWITSWILSLSLINKKIRHTFQILNSRIRTLMPQLMLNYFILILINIIFTYYAQEAYKSCENNFNKRAYGYFISSFEWKN